MTWQSLSPFCSTDETARPKGHQPAFGDASVGRDEAHQLIPYAIDSFIRDPCRTLHRNRRRPTPCAIQKKLPVSVLSCQKKRSWPSAILGRGAPRRAGG